MRNEAWRPPRFRPLCLAAVCEMPPPDKEVGDSGDKQQPDAEQQRNGSVRIEILGLMKIVWVLRRSKLPSAGIDEIRYADEDEEDARLNISKHFGQRARIGRDGV